MKKVRDSIFIAILSILLIASPLLQVSAAGPGDEKNPNATTVASGSCGDTAKFVLDSNGLLKITGSGTVDDNSGWYDYMDQIQKIEVSGPSILGSHLFWDHTNLKSIVLGDSVTEIGDNCFSQPAYEDDSVLESVQIGKGIKKIGLGAFYGNKMLKKVYISDLAAWCSVDIAYPTDKTAVHYNASPLSYGAELIFNGKTVTDLVVPDTVTRIGTNAFYQYEYLESVVIPASVTKMGVYAFAYTPNLTTATFLGHAPEAELHYYNSSMTYASGTFCGDSGEVTIYQPLDDTTYTNFARCMYSSTYSVTVSPDDDPNEDWPDLYLEKSNVPYIDRRITWAEWNSNWISHGGCGENMSWILDKNGWLWINGTGDMDADAYKYQWDDYTDEIEMVVVGEGVNSISRYSRPYGWYTKGVWLPKSLQHINEYNFDCFDPIGVYYQGSESDWSSIEIDQGNDALNKEVTAYNINSPDDIVFATAIKKSWNDNTEYRIPTLETMQLTASVEPSNATLKNIIWESYNPEVASVDENGVVTAHTCGFTYITAYAPGGGISEDCMFRILYYDVAGSPIKGDPDYQYFFEPVYWAADNGITKGYGNVYFGPDEKCTREQMITFLYRTAGSPKVSGTVNFSDVKKGTYYYNAVLWAYQNGITKGYSSGPNKGKFGVGLNVTREDTVTFIYRMAGKPSYSTSKSFKDVAKGKYYYDAVRWAAQKGITNGYSDGTFGVGKDVLRKDIVTFLYRYKMYH